MKNDKKPMTALARMIAKAKQAGFEVRIRHHRVFACKGDGEYAVGIRQANGLIDNVMTIRQFEQARREGQLETNGLKIFVTYPLRYLVQPRGGFTTVELVRDGYRQTGKFNANNKPFWRSVGALAALGRALKATPQPIEESAAAPTAEEVF